MKRLFATDTSWVSLFQRIVLAAVIFPHGAQKLLGWWGGHGFAGTLEYFTGQGLPAFLVFLIILTESFGSIALAFGLLTRLVALGISCIMVGAIATVHWQNGFFMNWAGDQKGEGFEYHLLVLGLALPLILVGGGRYSVDRGIVTGFGPPTRRPHTVTTMPRS